MSLKDPNPVNPRAPKRIALVIANPAVSTTTGWPRAPASRRRGWSSRPWAADGRRTT